MALLSFSFSLLSCILIIIIRSCTGGLAFVSAGHYLLVTMLIMTNYAMFLLFQNSLALYLTSIDSTAVAGRHLSYWKEGKLRGVASMWPLTGHLDCYIGLQGGQTRQPCFSACLELCNRRATKFNNTLL